MLSPSQPYFSVSVPYDSALNFEQDCFEHFLILFVSIKTL